MPPFLQFVIRRFLVIPVSLVIVTMVLYGEVMLTPPEARAQLYLPPGAGGSRASENVIKGYIRENHLDAPYPIQYAYWVRSLLQGSWGYSPSLNLGVLPALLRRTPATLELTLYSLLIFVPFGSASGVAAGWKPYQWGDMLSRGRDWILNASGLLRYWWVYIPATAAVMLFGIAWNLLGDGINDLLDPYLL